MCNSFQVRHIHTCSRKREQLGGIGGVMDEWMGGWMHDGTDNWMDAWMDGWMHGRMDRLMDELKDGWKALMNG